MHTFFTKKTHEHIRVTAENSALPLHMVAIGSHKIAYVIASVVIVIYLTSVICNAINNARNHDANI
jgi:hypothetical protein